MAAAKSTINNNTLKNNDDSKSKNLRISAPEICTEKLVGLPFSANSLTEPYEPTLIIQTQPGTDQGFSFDIARLDNSLNIEINGTLISNMEIQFQQGGTSGQTIKFADGTIYGLNGMKQIHQLVGSLENPVVRINISPEGDVTMFGSKVANGPLFPLVLFNGAAFNRVVWNKNTPNNTVITQSVSGFTRIEGQGYGLNQIECPEICTEQIVGLPISAFNITQPYQPTLITQSQPGTDQGFIFDLYRLDNSFKMEINGTQIFNDEIQFSGATPGGINIRFEDGTEYEADGNRIWKIRGTPEAPMLRIAISPSGVVTMFGSKVSGGPLFPLELKNNALFNNVVWNTNESNLIVITQIAVGATYIQGQGFGFNQIPCTCFNPANTTTPGSDSKVGITLLNRAGAGSAGNWPMARKSGHLVLESNSKGFVISRIAKADLGNIAAPQEGMMVYDTTDKCLKLFSDGMWSCFSTPTCP